MSVETVVVHPNRERPETKSTKGAVVLLLTTTALLTLIVLVGGWPRIMGLKVITIVVAALFAIMAYYVSHWSQGTLAMAAGAAMLYGMGLATAVPGWFARDKPGLDDPLLPSGLIGLLTLVLLVVQIVVIIFALVAFRQKWNVEVEVPREEAEGGVAEMFDAGGQRVDHEDEGRG